MEQELKQKQIEEMVLAVYPWLKEVPIEERKQLSENVSGLMVMERLYNAGYRKIPESAVVLDKDFCDNREEMIVDLQYDKFELMNEISEKDNKIALLEETIDCIKFNVYFTRKETAEKFAEKVHNLFNRDIKDSVVYTQEEKDILKDFVDSIYEICKEITEGEKEISNETI